jgi:methionyl aminopeptidase
MLGIEAARPGNHVGDIGHAIQTHAEKHCYGVVRDFCGHTASTFDDAPEPFTRDVWDHSELRRMIATIEPMITIGGAAAGGGIATAGRAVTRDRA